LQGGDLRDEFFTEGGCIGHVKPLPLFVLLVVFE
jgi:hypothetical protein